MFESVFEIFRVVSLLLGQFSKETIVIKHPTGTIYQARLVVVILCNFFNNHINYTVYSNFYYRSPLSFETADLNNAVLGSEQEGEFIRLPSFSALNPQLAQYKTVITQVCVHYHLVYACLCLCCHPQYFLTELFSFLDDHILRESPSI